MPLRVHSDSGVSDSNVTRSGEACLPTASDRVDETTDWRVEAPSQSKCPRVDTSGTGDVTFVTRRFRRHRAPLLCPLKPHWEYWLAIFPQLSQFQSPATRGLQGIDVLRDVEEQKQHEQVRWIPSSREWGADPVSRVGRPGGHDPDRARQPLPRPHADGAANELVVETCAILSVPARDWAAST